MAKADKSAQIIEAEAICEVCGWEVESTNAVGLAAQHFLRTGHAVASTQTFSVIFGKGEGG